MTARAARWASGLFPCRAARIDGTSGSSRRRNSASGWPSRVASRGGGMGSSFAWPLATPGPIARAMAKVTPMRAVHRIETNERGTARAPIAAFATLSVSPEIAGQDSAHSGACAPPQLESNGDNGCAGWTPGGPRPPCYKAPPLAVHRRQSRSVPRPRRMQSLTILPESPAPEPARHRLPAWLKRSLPRGNENFFTYTLLRDLGLETVCENARCPNRPECYSRRTATFMILGNVCTRPCGFCSVPRGETLDVEADEPVRVAEAAARLGLRHVVITSVTRDDLPDGGADHFYRCVLTVRERTGAAVEVLTPDLVGDPAAIDRVLDARPEVFNHNLETVPRLYRKVRGKADYRRSLDLLRRVKLRAPEVVTKSGLMLGIGETVAELFDVFADLRETGCDVLTLGQYLAPTLKHIPVARFLPPAEFDAIARQARNFGFKQVVAGPFVRSSYHAEEMVPGSEGP